MDCKLVEEHLASYVFGAMETHETARFNKHVNSCADCTKLIEQHGDILVDLAQAVPQHPAPAHVKRRLMARIDAETAPEPPRPAPGIRLSWGSVVATFTGRLAAQSATVAAVVVVGALVYGGFWASNRLNTIEDLQSALVASRVDEVEFKEKTEQQRSLTQMLANARGSTTVKTLSATTAPASEGPQQEPLGVVLVSSENGNAIISATDLPQLPEGHVYQIWMVRDGGVEVRTGVLRVDSSGYGQTTIDLSGPLGDFKAILITVEREGSEENSKGESVLRGDL